MKLLFLAALVATGACSWWPTSDESGAPITQNNKFTSGNEYVYKYESQVLTGIPHLSKQYSGIKITSKAKIAFSSATAATLQLDEVQVYSMNHEIQNPQQLPVRQQISIDQFSPLSSEQARLVTERLQRPIKFSYQSGKIEEIEICSEESNWSVDLKRSILSMLQVRLQASDFSVTQNLQYNNLEKENSTSFDVLEKGLDGECYSSIKVQQSNNSTQRFQVVKSRDETRCLSLNRQRKDVQPHQQYNCQCEDNMNQKNCQCQPEQQSRQQQTEIRTLYDITSENHQDILIHRAVQTIQYRFQTSNTPNQFMLTTSNQTLSLIEESEQQTISTSGCSFQSVSQPWKQQVLSQSQEKPMMSEQQINQQVRDALSELETITSDSQRYDDQTTVFSQLISHLSVCTNSQLQTLFQEAKGNDNTSNNKKWKLLIDAMSYVNDNNARCAKFLCKKVVDNQIQGLEANSIFAIWSADKLPTTQLLDTMKDSVLPTLQSDNTRRSNYKHAMLSFASMIRRYIANQQREQSEAVQESQKTQHQSNIDNCRKYQKYVEGRLSTANSEQDKILCLKAVNNMGNIQSLPTVQRLLQRSESRAVRIQAIWAFSYFGQQNQLQTLQSLLPLMNNQQEDSEIRFAAFRMVMRCDPSSSLLSVQKQLAQENDNEYKSFVVRYLKNCLHRREPGHQQRNSKIRAILRQIPAFQLSHQSVDFEMAIPVNGDENNGDIVKFRFLGNQTSRFSRTGAFMQLSLVEGVRKHFVEIGYRAEGLEQVIQKLTQQSSAISNSHADLRALDKLQNQKNKEQVKPSITICVKLMGQAITYIHLDESDVNNMIVQGLRTNTDGHVQIPVKFFQTIFLRPNSNTKLLPNGMSQSVETVHSGVIDVDGQIKIRVVKGEMPTIRFETTKPVRKELQTYQTQSVDAGFSISGVSTSVSVRRTVNSSNYTISYSPQENKFVMNHTEPQSNNDLGTQELRSQMVTFVRPQRLPVVIKSRNVCNKEMKTDDSQRQHFTHQFKSMKSVEINAQAECDVDKSQLYNFIRERLHLLPTSPSTQNQHIKISLKPDTSSQRNFTFTVGGRFFRSSELENMEAQNWSQQKQSHRQSQKQQNKNGGMFDFLWGSQDNEEEQWQPEPISTQQFLRSDSLGSLYYFQYFTLSSESNNRVRNMTGNMTTFYEHNYPTTRSLIRFQRPAIPRSQEMDTVVFTNKMVSTVNPGNNEFIWAHNMSWGERSHGQRSNLTWTIRLTPDYKDGVCYSQNVEGCSDGNGVSYPVNYNVTHQFRFNHTDIVERYLNASRSYLMNSAQRLFSEVIFQHNGQQQSQQQWQQQWQQQSQQQQGQQQQQWNQQGQQQNQQQSQQNGQFNISQTIRPSSNRVDMKFPMHPRSSVCINMNASHIYSPMEVEFWQWMSQSQYPVSQIKSIHDYLPVYHRSNPFESRRDVCVIQSPRSLTFGKQEVTMPQTDCEVILAGDCRSINKQLLVSIKPASNQGKTAERELKTVVGSNKIQIFFTPSSTFSAQHMKVKVNNIERQLNQDNQVVVEESRKPVAIVQCDNIKCEVLSEKYGVYVSIDSQRVAVEVNAEKSHEMCGLCSFNPERRQQQLNATDSVNWWKQNQVQNSQCTIQEPSRQQQQDSCNQQYKHKVKSTVDQKGRMQTCVSVNRLPVCSSRCNQKSIRTNSEQFRCVSQQQAQQLEITPRIEGEDLVIDDERILRRLQNSQQIQSNVNIAMSCQN